MLCYSVMLAGLTCGGVYSFLDGLGPARQSFPYEIAFPFYKEKQGGFNPEISMRSTPRKML